MDWVKTINRAIEYMEDHLTEDIALKDIAGSIHLSAFHFQRAFSLLTGMSPAEYLRKRRLSEAGAVLADGRVKVIDAALKYGYDTPESFAKAFTRHHGVTPTQVKNGSSIRFMNRYSVRITIEGGSVMEYRNISWIAVRQDASVIPFYTWQAQNSSRTGTGRNKKPPRAGREGLCRMDKSVSRSPLRGRSGRTRICRPGSSSAPRRLRRGCGRARRSSRSPRNG